MAQIELVQDGDTTWGPEMRQVIGAVNALDGTTTANIPDTIRNTVRAMPVRSLPVTIPFASSITINTSTSSFGHINATGNFTLAEPSGASEGQIYLVRVAAVSGQRVMTYAAGFRRGDFASTLTIPSGQRGYVLLQYEAAYGWTVLGSRIS